MRWVSPFSTETADFGKPSAFASSASMAALALPFSGAARDTDFQEALAGCVFGHALDCILRSARLGPYAQFGAAGDEAPGGSRQPNCSAQKAPA